MKINPKHVQLIGEAAIPLLGFFLWDWSLYFILLFYILDLFTAEVFIQIKSNRIFRHQNKGNRERKRGTLISIIVFLALLVNIHFGMKMIALDIDFSKEVIAFLFYEELGVPQGIILVPLIVLMSYQQYKMEFLMRASYRIIQMKSLWNSHILPRVTMLIASIIVIGLSLFVHLPEVVYLLAIVSFSTLYQLLESRR